MGDIIDFNSDNNIMDSQIDITALTEELLTDVRREEITKENSISVPIGQLAALGAGVSSLIPAFRTITQTVTLNNPGLYRVANMTVEDTLKMAKDGNFWGAFNTPDGKSVFAKLQEVQTSDVTSKTKLPIDPATMMMAVALFSIEQELGNIADMEKQILSFLQIEKEAEIEADVITLSDLVTNYKHNWNNERYISSNHKLACDIRRTARKNMISYQKLVAEAVKSKQFIVLGNQVDSALKDLEKKFKYYRLTLYTFALSSLAEIMLSGNFKEENINAAISEIIKNADEYRSLFNDCSAHLEKMSKSSIESSILKGVGATSAAMGKLIGSIPKVKDGQVDEYLLEKGDKFKNGAQKISRDVIESFEKVSDPGVDTMIGKLEDMERIYNKTTSICFDKDNIYLVAG